MAAIFREKEDAEPDESKSPPAGPEGLGFGFCLARKCAHYPVRSNSMRSGRGIRVEICAGSKITADSPSICNVSSGGGKRQMPREDMMAAEDDDKPRKKITHEIGQDLYLLSVEELAERIALLTSEIERLQEAMTKKRATRDAAANFFKK
jgi:uncharacterized small protein (DUF1192 family)